MIKIRYSDLPQGRHAHVHRAGRRSVIYLLPGLSPAQRRDALGRLVRTSRQGYGPRLRAPGVRFAVARDVAKTTVRNALAAFIERTKADELMITAQIFDHSARLRSYEIAADIQKTLN